MVLPLSITRLRDILQFGLIVGILVEPVIINNNFEKKRLNVTENWGAVGIQWEDLCCFSKALNCTFCHVERSAAKSRHLAADMACLSFVARFLHYGLRPPVGMTSGENESQSATEYRPTRELEQVLL